MATLSDVQKDLTVLFEFMLANPDPDLEERFVKALKEYRVLHLSSQREALDEATKKAAEQSV